MPTTTPILALPYPVASDTANVPRDIQALAVKLESYTSLRPPPVTSLPGSPVDGQECYYLADATNGIVWPLRYRAASASTYKWESIGAVSPLSNEVATVNGAAGTTYATAGLGGPSLTVPLAGEYIVTQAATIEAALAAGWRGRMSYNSSDATCVFVSGAGGAGSPASGASVARALRATLAAAVLTCAYRSDSGANINYSNRYFGIQPIRVG